MAALPIPVSPLALPSYRIAVAVLVLAPRPEAAAQVALAVEAPTRLSVETRAEGGALEVQGTLTDDLGTPLEDRVVRVDAGAASLTLRTDARGRFAASTHGQARMVAVRVRFDGAPHHLPTEWHATVDAAREPVQLTMGLASARIDLNIPSHVVRLQANAPSNAADLEVALSDERGRSLARAVTDAQGRATLRLSSRQLGAPGAGRLTATSAADSARQAARVELPIVRYAATQLSVAAHPSPETARARIEGTLRAGRAPLAARTVTLFIDGRARFDLRTDGEGRFAREVERADEQPLSVEARYVPEVSWLGPSRSRPVTIAPRTLGTPSVWWLALPLALCAPALFALWKRGERLDPQAPLPSTLRGTGSAVYEASRRARQPASTTLGGQIVDAVTLRPLPHARAHVQTASFTEHPLAVDSEGRFRCDDLPPGQAQLRVDADGFLGVTHGLSLPHRGELAQMSVRLCSTRARALGILYEVAVPALAPAADALRLTPAEIAAATGRQGAAAHGALRTLAQRVEHVAYARATPGSAELSAIDAEAERARSELGQHENGSQQRR